MRPTAKLAGRWTDVSASLGRALAWAVAGAVAGVRKPAALGRAAVRRSNPATRHIKI